MEDYQTTLTQDKQGVALLEEALEAAYEDGYNDAADRRSSRASEVITNPQQLWEKLMAIIEVTV